MYKIDNGIVHGSSYAIRLKEVELLTWRLNEETNEYWLKFHVPSGKEVRIKVAEYDVRHIVEEWALTEIDLEIGDEYGLDN